MSAPDRIDHNPALIQPLQPAGAPAKTDVPGRTSGGQSFNDILRTKVAANVVATPASLPAADVERSIKFSAHAAARLAQRGIDLTDSQFARLESAVNKAGAKGGRDALVLLDDVAMVVSVKNRTVITALAQQQAKDNVFTNIDTAVIA